MSWRLASNMRCSNRKRIGHCTAAVAYYRCLSMLKPGRNLWPNFTTPQFHYIKQSNLGTGRVATPPMHHPKPQLCTFAVTLTPQTAYWLNAAPPPHSPSNTPYHRPIPKPSYLPYPWIHPTYHTQTASKPYQPFCHNELDRETTGMFGVYRPLSLYRECRDLTTQRAYIFNLAPND